MNPTTNLQRGDYRPLPNKSGSGRQNSLAWLAVCLGEGKLISNPGGQNPIPLALTDNLSTPHFLGKLPEPCFTALQTFPGQSLSRTIQRVSRLTINVEVLVVGELVEKYDAIGPR